MPKGQTRAIDGRREELGILSAALEKAKEGRGGCILVLGEPGIGKSRLLDEFKKTAESNGALLLCGAAKADSAEPFHPFAAALADRLPEGVLSPRHEVGFKEVFIFDERGGIVSGSDSGTEAMAGMLNAVQGFVGDSFQGGTGSLGRLEFGETKVLIQRRRGIFLVGVVEGAEHDGMAAALTGALQAMESRLGEVLGNWSGDLREILGGVPELNALREARFHLRKGLEGLSLESERTRIAETVARTLRELASERVVALVLEDLHWADPSSLSLLTFAARNAKGTKILIISTARTGEGEAFHNAREAMKDEETVTELALGGLSADEVARLVGAIYSPNEFGQVFLNRLAEDSRGNPLFIIEVLRQLESESGILRERGTYLLTKGSYSMPGSVEEVVRRRLDSLDPDTLTEAEYASCIGVEFLQEAALSIETLADAPGALRKLAESGIFVADGERWRFSHAMFRQVVYAGISERWRASYHRSLGGHYERLFHGRLYDGAYDLARHFKGCGDWGKALDYCTMAGEKAESAYAVEQALEFYKSALEALGKSNKSPDSPGLEAKLLERAGEMELKLGLADKAIERFGNVQRLIPGDPALTLRIALMKRAAYAAKNDSQAALAAMNEAAIWLDKAPGESRAEFLGYWAICSAQADKNEDAEVRAREALAQVHDVSDAARRSIIYTNVGRLYGSLGEFPKAMPILQKSVAEAESSGDSRALALAYTEMGTLMHFMTDHVQSALYLEKAAAHREKLGDIVGLGQTFAALGMAYSDSSNLEMSIACLKRALAINRKIGAEDSAATTLGNIGYSLAVMGRNEEALQYQRESLAIRIKRNGEMGTAWSYFDMSLVHSNTGDFEKERACLERADAIFSETGDKFGHAQTRMRLGQQLEQSGDIEGAMRAFGEALQIAESANITAMVLEAKRLLIESGNSSSADELSALDLEAGKLGDNGIRMALAETGAKLAMKLGDSALAIGRAERGLEIWKGLKTRDLDGQASSLLLYRAKAKFMVGDARGALADAEEASKIARGCGRTWLAGQAEEFARSLKTAPD
ncbi:MAG: AAA family ATPase [Methanobacteriota archaeon]